MDQSNSMYDLYYAFGGSLADVPDMCPPASQTSVQKEHTIHQAHYDNLGPNKSLTDISNYKTQQIITNEEQMYPDKNDETHELRSLLKSWDQEVLLDHFIDQNVFLNVLKVIKRHHIERLLRNFDMGTQILFEYNLEEWRQSIGLPLMSYGDESQNRSLSLSNPPSSASSPSCSRATTPTSSRLPRFTPYERQLSSSDDGSNLIMLSNILNESTKGTMLAEYYSKFSKFQDEQRFSLIGTIAQFFEEKGVPMTYKSSPRAGNFGKIS